LHTKNKISIYFIWIIGITAAPTLCLNGINDQ